MQIRYIKKLGILVSYLVKDLDMSPSLLKLHLSHPNFTPQFCCTFEDALDFALAYAIKALAGGAAPWKRNTFNLKKGIPSRGLTYPPKI